MVKLKKGITFEGNGFYGSDQCYVDRALADYDISNHLLSELNFTYLHGENTSKNSIYNFCEDALRKKEDEEGMKEVQSKIDNLENRLLRMEKGKNDFKDTARRNRKTGV